MNIAYRLPFLTVYPLLPFTVCNDQASNRTHDILMLSELLTISYRLPCFTVDACLAFATLTVYRFRPL